MNYKIKDILNTIESNGFEAYVVGGYVRDNLLSINSCDVDICTNALPKDLNLIFKGSLNNSCYGAFKITTDLYNFDITTYRKEISYSNRKPTEIVYVNSLIEDINRRDFTINTICMNSNGDIIDYLGGIQDLKNKCIKCVGDAQNKFKEDPLRILRAIRFAVVLDFNLDKSVIKAIKKNHKLIRSLSFDRRKIELDKIFSSKYVFRGISLLKSLGIIKDLDIKFKSLVSVDDICGMWAQMEYNELYTFNNKEKNNIIKIKEVLKYGKIDNYILYKEGLYICGVSGSIMNYDRALITSMYNELDIHSRSDINISSKDIIKLLDIKPSNIINSVYNDLEINILNKKIKNDYIELSKYIMDNKWRYLNG